MTHKFIVAPDTEQQNLSDSVGAVPAVFRIRHFCWMRIRILLLEFKVF
jgi:hypothetical protein